MTERIDFNRTVREWPQVQAFSCGTTPWEIEVGKWISAPDSAKFDSALYCVEHGKCSVWLHVFPGEPPEVVGFTSLGQTKWKFDGSETKLPLQIIPNCAVGTKYQGQPLGVPQSERHAHKIFKGLLSEAARRWKEAAAPKLLALFVHPSNLRAIKFYKAHGFKVLPAPMPNGYTGMTRELEDSDL